MVSAWSWRHWIFCPCACRSSRGGAWDKDARLAPGAVSAINGMPQPDSDGGSEACSLRGEAGSGPSSSSSQRLRISSRAAACCWLACAAYCS
jgi:hypothetical protein